MSRVYEYYQEGELTPLDQEQLEYLEWYNQQKQQENENKDTKK